MRSAPALLLLLAACGGPAAPAVPPPALTASLAPGADGSRELAVVLEAGSAPVDLTALQLRGGGFAQAPPSPVATTLAAGSSATLPLPYGPVLCAGRPAPVAVVADTSAGRLDLPVADPALLAERRAAECG